MCQQYIELSVTEPGAGALLLAALQLTQHSGGDQHLIEGDLKKYKKNSLTSYFLMYVMC